MQLGSAVKRARKAFDVLCYMGWPKTKRLRKKRWTRLQRVEDAMSQMTRIAFGGRR